MGRGCQMRLMGQAVDALRDSEWGVVGRRQAAKRGATVGFGLLLPVRRCTAGSLPYPGRPCKQRAGAFEHVVG